MRDRWNHEPARRSAVSPTAIDTLSAFIEATGDAASTIGNARLRALQRSVAASACACLPVCATGLRATPPKEWILGQFAEHENDVDRLLCPSPPKHFLTRHGWVAFPYTALSFLSVLGTVPGCLLALTFEASSQPPFDKRGPGGPALSRSLTATKQTLATGQDIRIVCWTHLRLLRALLGGLVAQSRENMWLVCWWFGGRCLWLGSR